MSNATMHGLVYRGPRERTQIEEVAVPSPAAGQVLMKVGAVGVCGTDIHVWQGDNHQMEGPRILGHEFAGEVVALGAGVSEFRVGERVVSETASWVCGVCPYCRAGQYNVCPTRKGFGFGADGAMANYVLSRPAILHRIPNRVSMAHASMTEPGCVAYNAIFEKSRPRPADHAVVLGPGPIGLMCIAMLRIAGVGRISVIGLRRDGHRLDLAKTMGADDVLVVTALVRISSSMPSASPKPSINRSTWSAPMAKSPKSAGVLHPSASVSIASSSRLPHCRARSAICTAPGNVCWR
jgi:alcohol dehydrogenase/L-iditol 2-dehydrogenase